MNSEEIRDLHKKYLFPCVANYYQQSLPLSRGKGIHLYDPEGREYLDFFGAAFGLPRRERLRLIVVLRDALGALDRLRLGRGGRRLEDQVWITTREGYRLHAGREQQPVCRPKPQGGPARICWTPETSLPKPDATESARSLGWPLIRGR